MLKVSLLFKKFTNFTDKTIFKVLFLYEHKHIQRFSNLYQCTLKVRLSFVLLYNRFHQLATFVIVVNVCKLNPLSANPTKWSNTLKQFVGNLPTNYLSVIDHFVKLVLKGLTQNSEYILKNT